jgi:hypothetical protein
MFLQYEMRKKADKTIFAKAGGRASMTVECLIQFYC